MQSIIAAEHFFCFFNDWIDLGWVSWCWRSRCVRCMPRTTEEWPVWIHAFFPTGKGGYERNVDAIIRCFGHNFGLKKTIFFFSFSFWSPKKIEVEGEQWVTINFTDFAALFWKIKDLFWEDFHYCKRYIQKLPSSLSKMRNYNVLVEFRLDLLLLLLLLRRHDWLKNI